MQKPLGPIIKQERTSEPPQLPSPAKPAAPATPVSPDKPVTPLPSRKRIRAGRTDMTLTPQDPKLPKEKKRKLSEKQERKQKLAEAKDLLSKSGFDHNRRFQKLHYDANNPPKSGHWDEFCLHFLTSAYTKCSVCNTMLDEEWDKSKKTQPVQEGLPCADVQDIQEGSPRHIYK